jgi:hypothetical protein
MRARYTRVLFRADKSMHLWWKIRKAFGTIQTLIPFVSKAVELDRHAACFLRNDEGAFISLRRFLSNPPVQRPWAFQTLFLWNLPNRSKLSD